MWKPFMASAGAIALLATAAVAQTDTSGTTSGTTSTDMVTTSAASGADFIPAQEPSQTRADELLGASVLNSAGEELGTVSDLVIDPQGKIIGVVVGSGGFLGIGAKPVAVPWQSLQMGAEEELVVAMSAEEFANAPEFKTKEDLEAEQQAQSGVTGGATGMGSSTSTGSTTTGGTGTSGTTTTQ
jgi:sporulation protein YlmC with PRC-barrel domain